ncbi:Hsp20/alpha crystallin family protein [Lederbergia lenta]|uniref:Spore coat protein n=1 Tax=Lederbergia lenta TaxID=1467 RepID=A0A2X4WJ67_LEDLE|nr:Hsp20/alpha crystallin family protein [Lederbergia lenta]MCM3109421.1 Hsp20/alpha crystallin family protein [Lederbergia lenta]MEC2324814.1 Hsp20/alpha crystallin family protein [Lederbergia lenta]SQI57610.1 spore coat protein [Lederbergia lenta]
MIPWGSFPFKDEFKKMAEEMKPGDIQSYVNDMMRKFNISQFPDTQEKSPSTSEDTALGSNVFETFDYVYIRLTLPKEVTLKQLRIFHTSNQAILENIHEEGSRKVIVLPCVVKKKGATAQVKDNILEIKIPKSDDLQFTEISISEKL